MVGEVVVVAEAATDPHNLSSNRQAEAVPQATTVTLQIRVGRKIAAGIPPQAVVVDNSLDAATGNVKT
jgi:hypothetical protein